MDSKPGKDAAKPQIVGADPGKSTPNREMLAQRQKELIISSKMRRGARKNRRWTENRGAEPEVVSRQARKFPPGKFADPEKASDETGKLARR